MNTDEVCNFYHTFVIIIEKIHQEMIRPKVTHIHMGRVRRGSRCWVGFGNRRFDEHAHLIPSGRQSRVHSTRGLVPAVSLQHCWRAWAFPPAQMDSLGFASRGPVLVPLCNAPLRPPSKPSEVAAATVRPNAAHNELRRYVII